MAEPQWYESSYGGLRLFFTRISTDVSRTIIVHELSSGDEHPVDDRGKVALRARCTALFAWMKDDELAPLDRLRALRALVDDKPRICSHPVEGSFLARVGPFTYEVNQDGNLEAEIEFIAVQPVAAVSPAGAGGVPSSGEGAVTAAAEVLRTELAELEVESTLPDDAIAAADSWGAAEGLNPREVYTQTGSLTEQLGDLAEDLEGDLDSWAAFKATIQLADAVRAAAEAATSDTAQTFTVRIATPVALRALLASIYGADEVDLRYLQAMQLNDIASPAWLEPGLEYQFPSPRASARNG